MREDLADRERGIEPFDRLDGDGLIFFFLQ